MALKGLVTKEKIVPWNFLMADVAIVGIRYSMILFPNFRRQYVVK